MSDRRRLGTLLVTLQLALIAALAALALPAFAVGDAPAGAWVTLGASTLLGLWALAFNRPGNFNIRPEPRAGATVVQDGPYRWIRHPMYTAVIGFALACAWASASWWGWASVAALTGVLATKATFEERWMLERHRDYAAYRKRTRRFVPWLF